MSKKEMICIACPRGCHLQVETITNGTATNGTGSNGTTAYAVTGNQCPRGEKYGIKEMTNPTRMVTSTVVIRNGQLNRLPVRTSEPIPKHKIFECMQAINQVQIEGPVKVGDVIIKDLLGLGVNIIASRSM